ncbi:MAG: GNAT family N-acetyltransferase [candidate division Zixibacteria bacterium]|nr:GNAT family N-acetyltransferase [candidate division Zixibacteria bacterium]
MNQSYCELDISIMTEKDFDFAVEMTDNEKWGYLCSDFEKLKAFEPEGCFVARSEGQPVGIITSTSYDDYGFVGTLIVRKTHRHKKIGERLLSHAIDFLENKDVKTIELDGVFAAVSLYRRLGFRDKYLSLRFFRPPAPVKHTSEPLNPDPAGDIIEFDLQHTGIMRQRLLKRYLNEYRDAVYTVREPGLEAFAFARPRAGGLKTIGPMVAANKKAAQILIMNLISKYTDTRLTMGVPEHNHTMVKLLYKQGFYYNPPSLRMYRGKKKEYEKNIYGILSPEKG